MVKNQTILSQPHLSDQEKSFSLKSESSSKFEIKKK